MSVVNSVISTRSWMHQTDTVQCVWNMAARKLGHSWKSHRSWRGRPPRWLRNCKMPWTTASRSMHLRRFWDRRKKWVGSRMVWLGRSQSQSPTSQLWMIVPAGCYQKWFERQGQMARPGWIRGQIIITTIPEMKICAETIIPTPETMVLPDTGLNGVIHPAVIAVITIVQHQIQDGPVTEAGSGVQRLAWQLLPVLVTVIQRDSRDHRGGLMPRTGYAVQRPSRQPHPCRSVRPPAMVIFLVIRINTTGMWRGSWMWFNGVSGISIHAQACVIDFTPFQVIQQWWARETHSASVSEVYRYSPGMRHNTTGGRPSRDYRPATGCRHVRDGWSTRDCKAREAGTIPMCPMVARLLEQPRLQQQAGIDRIQVGAHLAGFAHQWWSLLRTCWATNTVEERVGLNLHQQLPLTHHSISFCTRNSHQDL